LKTAIGFFRFFVGETEFNAFFSSFLFFSQENSNFQNNQKEQHFKIKFKKKTER
jgi:hypothetical protein